MASDYKISRRDLLKITSAITTVEIANAMLPIYKTYAQSTSAPARLLLIAKQHGWASRNPGEDLLIPDPNSPWGYKMPKELMALDQIREHVTVIDGVRGSFWGNAHDVSYSDIFTSAVPAEDLESEQLGKHFPEPMGPSLDWFLGDRLNKKVLRHSFYYKSWGRQWHPLCFDNSFTALPMSINYSQIYDEVAVPILKAQQDGNPNDSVLQNILSKELFKLSGQASNKVQNLLKGLERKKLETFKQALMSNTPQSSFEGSTNFTVPGKPESMTTPQEYDFILKMFEIAFRADTHRIGVLGLGPTYTAEFPWTDSNGVNKNGNTFGNDFHQDVAHYKDVDKELAFDGWNTWNLEKIVTFAKNLDKIMDVNGKSLLENTAIVLNGEVGTGNHDRRRKPIIIIGGRGAPGLTTGRLIKTATVEPRDRKGFFLGRELRDGSVEGDGVNYGEPYSQKTEADLLVALSRVMGVNINSFGLPLTNTGALDL